LTCITKWEQHVKTKSSGSIHEQLSSSHKLIVEKKRKYIKTLIEITLFLSKQGLAFRGHDESKLSSNKGE
jgi:phage terminase large subunit